MMFTYYFAEYAPHRSFYPLGQEVVRQIEVRRLSLQESDSTACGRMHASGVDRVESNINTSVCCRMVSTALLVLFPRPRSGEAD